MSFLDKIIGDKKAWREYKARSKALPTNYRTAIEAVERYLMYAGGTGGDADDWTRMFNDLIELFEQAAADGTPVRAIVGDDPVEFVETFAQNYPIGQWRSREQQRLISAIDSVAEPGS